MSGLPEDSVRKERGTFVSGGIYLMRDDGELVEMNERGYATEALLQEYLARHPNLLAGDQIDSSAPRRWLLVSQEMALASEEDGSGRWSVDHLFLDQDAVPTIVEVKRSTDTRIRREVVGQMLDYAANGVGYWSVDKLRAQFEANLESEQDISDLLEDPDADPEEFWRKVKTNLQAGKVRLIFVSDKIPDELRRIVEFLNEQMDPAEVLAVEIKQYVSQDSNLKTLVPRIIGQTVEARQKKSGTAGESSDKKRAYQTFFQKLIDELREHHDFTRARAGQLQNWYYFASGFTGISYALVFAQGGQVRAEVYIDRGDAGSNKELFDTLFEQQGSLSAEFGEELEWQRMDNRRFSRVGVYREGSIEDDQQVLEEIAEWAVDRLLKLKKVFGPRLSKAIS